MWAAPVRPSRPARRSLLSLARGQLVAVGSFLLRPIEVADVDVAGAVEVVDELRTGRPAVEAQVDLPAHHGGLADVEPEDLRTASGWADQAQEQFHRGCLPGAIWAKEAEDRIRYVK